MADFLTFDDEPDQYLFCCVLRSGSAVAKIGCLSLLNRLLPRLHKAFPKATIRIRLDAGFSGLELYEFFEAERMEYVVYMGQNPVLKRLAEPLTAPLRDTLEAGEDLIPRFGECRYRGMRILTGLFVAVPRLEPWVKAVVRRLQSTDQHVQILLQGHVVYRFDADNVVKDNSRAGQSTFETHGLS